MKTPYSFITLRYVHDVVTGEFANVGVVLYSPEARFLEARFSASYERLSALFLKVDSTHYRNMIRYLGHRFNDLSEDFKNGLSLRPVQELEAIVRTVLPQDDSSLQWSPSGAGLTSSPTETLRQVYSRMVERYLRAGEAQSRSDDEIVKPFRACLREAASRLQEKRIEATDYQYSFDSAWKNRIWHLYEPVSFDLIDPGNILDKANKWLGRGTALKDSEEEFKIHFLLGEPKSKDNEKAFRSAQHLMEKIPVQKELVHESEFEAFARKVIHEMELHDAENRIIKTDGTDLSTSSR